MISTSGTSPKDWAHKGRRRVLKGIAALAAGAVAVRARAAETSPRGESAELAATLARYAATLKYEDLPQDVVRITKRTILDTIGCAFGGYPAEPSRIALKLAGEVSAKQQRNRAVRRLCDEP